MQRRSTADLTLAERGPRPPRLQAGVFAPARYGLTDTQIDEIVATLGEVGFRDTTRQRREIGRERIEAIVARK